MESGAGKKIQIYDLTEDVIDLTKDPDSDSDVIAGDTPSVTPTASLSPSQEPHAYSADDENPFPGLGECGAHSIPRSESDNSPTAGSAGSQQDYSMNHAIGFAQDQSWLQPHPELQQESDESTEQKAPPEPRRSKRLKGEKPEFL